MKKMFNFAETAIGNIIVVGVVFGLPILLFVHAITTKG